MAAKRGGGVQLLAKAKGRQKNNRFFSDRTRRGKKKHLHEYTYMNNKGIDYRLVPGPLWCDF